MKFWNSEKELDALIETAANEVEVDKSSGVLNSTLLQEYTHAITPIHRAGSSKRGKWQDRIDSVKAEYERELERKKKLYDQTGNTDIFSPEDIDTMLFENETFRGKSINLSQVQKYNKLAAAAHTLIERHSDILEVDCPTLPQGRAGCITVDIRNVSSFSGEIKDSIAGMILLCDSYAIISMGKDVIHMSFFIRDIRIK